MQKIFDQLSTLDIMVYFYLFLLFVFLAIVTACFFRSLKSSQIPPNAKLIIDVWNATSNH
jgi:hypothetical protein